VRAHLRSSLLRESFSELTLVVVAAAGTELLKPTDGGLAKPSGSATSCSSRAPAPWAPLGAPQDSPLVRWGTRAVLPGSREAASRPPSEPAATLYVTYRALVSPGDQRSRVSEAGGRHHAHGWGHLVQQMLVPSDLANDVLHCCISTQILAQSCNVNPESTAICRD
jgi:hypothetical protein